MKFPLLTALFLLFRATSLQGQEMQSVIRFDTCASMPLNASVFTEAEVRPGESARWNNRQQSLENYLKPVFQNQLRKGAGGNIRLTLLINTEGKACLLQIKPNTNLHPDWKALKLKMDASTWKPALANGKPVMAEKFIVLSFNGKEMTAEELN